MELPTMQELFYGCNEPTWILNNLPVERPRFIAPQYPAFPRAPEYYVQQPQHSYEDVVRPLRRPKEVPVTVVSRPGVSSGSGPVSTFPSNLVLRVPLCCEKCMEKVTKALYEVDGVRSVVCEQSEQKVIVRGNAVDPERALRKVKRVKKKSVYWNMETSAIQSSRYNNAGAGGAAGHVVRSETHHNGYNAPRHSSSSSYTHVASPPRSSRSSYSAHRRSPHTSYYASPYDNPYGGENSYSVPDRYT